MSDPPDANTAATPSRRAASPRSGSPLPLESGIDGRGLDSRWGGAHGYRMEDRGIFNGRGFWVLALLWLPAGVVAQALVRFLPETGTHADSGLSPAMLPMLAGSLVLVAPCGLPLALGCRRVWRLGHPKGRSHVRDAVLRPTA